MVSIVYETFWPYQFNFGLVQKISKFFTWIKKLNKKSKNMEYLSYIRDNLKSNVLDQNI